MRMNRLRSEGMTVLQGRTRRHWQNILLTPIKIPHNLLKYGRIIPSIFWDLLGFAEFVLARKP